MNRPDTEFDRDQSEFQEEWLSAFLDGELSAEKRAIVEQRLATDPAVSRMLDDLKKVRQVVSELPIWTGPVRTIEIDENANVDGDDEPHPRQEASQLDDPSQLADIDSIVDREWEEGDHPPANTLISENVTGKKTDKNVGSRLWRPIALAAGLLAMLGVGYGLWRGSDRFQVASNSPTSDAQLAGSVRASEQVGGNTGAMMLEAGGAIDSPAKSTSALDSGDLSLAPLPQDNNSYAFSNESAADQLSFTAPQDDSVQSSRSMTRALRDDEQRMLGGTETEGLGLNDLSMSRGREGLGTRQAADDIALRLAEPNAEALRSTEAEDAAEAMTRDGFALRMASSDAWSEADIGQGLVATTNLFGPVTGWYQPQTASQQNLLRYFLTGPSQADAESKELPPILMAQLQAGPIDDQFKSMVDTFDFLVDLSTMAGSGTTRQQASSAGGGSAAGLGSGQAADAQGALDGRSQGAASNDPDERLERAVNPPQQQAAQLNELPPPIGTTAKQTAEDPNHLFDDVAATTAGEGLDLPSSRQIQSPGSSRRDSGMIVLFLSRQEADQLMQQLQSARTSGETELNSVVQITPSTADDKTPLPTDKVILIFSSPAR